MGAGGQDRKRSPPFFMNYLFPLIFSVNPVLQLSHALAGTELEAAGIERMLKVSISTSGFTLPFTGGSPVNKSVRVHPNPLVREDLMGMGDCRGQIFSPPTSEILPCLQPAAE